MTTHVDHARSHGATAVRETTETPRAPKSLRYKIGLGLLILYPFLYLVIPIAPMLPVSAGVKAGVVGGTIAVAEVIFLVAIALMGKEGYRAIKARLKKLTSRKRG